MVVKRATHMLSVGSALRTYVAAMPAPPFEEDCQAVMAVLPCSQTLLP